MMFFKKKQEKIKIDYPEKEYLNAEIPAFNFFEDGLVYDTFKAEVVKIYTYKDVTPESLFGIIDLSTNLTFDSLVQKRNSKVILFKTVLNNWFSVYFVNDKAHGYSPMTKKNVARIFELNDDRENYERYFQLLTRA